MVQLLVDVVQLYRYTVSLETSTVAHVKSLVYTMFASMFVILLRASAEVCLSIHIAMSIYPSVHL